MARPKKPSELKLRHIATNVLPAFEKEIEDLAAESGEAKAEVIRLAIVAGLPLVPDRLRKKPLPTDKTQETGAVVGRVKRTLGIVGLATALSLPTASTRAETVGFTESEGKEPCVGQRPRAVRRPPRWDARKPKVRKVG
jgi:hypothetical protein